MQQYDPERLFRRSMRRTDVLRAVLAGVLLGVCIIVSAYVSLSAGLLMSIGALLLLGAFWSYTHQRRQQPVTATVTVPALNEAFEQPVRTLPAAVPGQEMAALFPPDAKCRCRNQVTASWHGLSFTFSNLAVRVKTQRAPIFHGQFLSVRTDWQVPGRVELSQQTNAAPGIAPAADGALPAVDSALLRAYRVDTNAPEKAASLLSCRLLQTLLLQNLGTHLLVDGDRVSIAIPSDEPFFELTGLEESAAQVRDAHHRQIAVIQSWLDSLLAVPMPSNFTS